MTVPRRCLTIAVLLSAFVGLTGCSGSGTEDSAASPEQPLAAAKKTLDTTAGVHIVLNTEKLPAGVNGILRADGIGTHAPAFDGEIKVAASGITADVPVVSVDNVVYAKLPFTSKFAEIDPGDYGAPDPAVLMGQTAGLSSLLTSAQDVHKGKEQRDGAEVLSTYTGTLPGKAVAGIIPSADPTSDFDATFTITKKAVLNEAVLTGPFYPSGGEVTYTVRFDKYGTHKDITKP